MYRLVHEAGMFFDKDTWVGFETASMEFLKTYQWLSQECSKADKKQYNIVPKFHYFYHLVQQSRDINPRFVWCYGGENWWEGAVAWHTVVLGAHQVNKSPLK